MRFSLSKSYETIRKSIVAFIPKYWPIKESQHELLFPPILGTGFIVKDSGIILTNKHIIDAFREFPRPPDVNKEDWCALALLFYYTEKYGQLEIPLEIIGTMMIDTFDGGDPYYGPDKPDLAGVYVKARELPALDIDDSRNIVEGMEVATAGFPMGANALTAPGWLQQITPTLQQGIVSSVLPCPGVDLHAFTINVMTQGGASGSPVFFPDTGKVAGILNAGLVDISYTKDGVIRLPTNISYVVPSRYIKMFLGSSVNYKPPPDAQTIEELIKDKDVVVRSDELRDRSR